MTDMLGAIREAQAGAFRRRSSSSSSRHQKRAMGRLDFVSSENSMGLHADQEAARLLAESIDESRRAQALAFRLRAPRAPALAPPAAGVEGVTPTEKPPAAR
jgi:nitrite reductase (cytochrome c-552)